MVKMKVVHICCASPQAVYVEYFHDHTRIENLPFDGVEKPKNGELSPDLARFGLGLEIRCSDVSRHAAS